MNENRMIALLRGWAKGHPADPLGEECLTVNRLQAAEIVNAYDASAPSASARQAELEPVDGDVLPAVGSDVLIHLASQDEWVSHKVVGYYVWPDRSGNPFLQRVNVRVQDSAGYLNARMLRDVRRLDGTPFVVDKRAAAPAPSASPESLLQALSIARQHVPNGTEDAERVDAAIRGMIQPTASPAALTDEAAMRVALRIMANLEDRNGLLDGVDDDTKADIADEIAVTIRAASPADQGEDARDAARWRAHFELMRPETTARGLREYLEAVEAKARAMSATPPAAEGDKS